ncbi:AGC/YANK protein kinase [Allomyces macrogynus ATCC 38327]|uniref:AGC/YANK protein kinase n=1 Tax=Allomyces macrogynus (strain ATCC 38327) TaxID=578462 RepID=A0A0L0SGN5_ALLM3|nr:AGC/YANK protein kinase [Allomyces macrogynus ATCC 38327]|eukprot:KNE61678.1 AGC/YANK protein kinase [Allomyces macrogynus ATCC 38327]
MGGQWSEPVDLNGPVELRHFHIGRVIGKGAFGKVRIIERRGPDKTTYALKYMSKEHIIKQRAYRNIIRERQLLEKVFHPFIVNLCFAWQDDLYLYMAFDLMLGGDLRFHLGRHDRLPEAVVAFYAAEVSSALIYLHSRKVIHRDVKPDNLLLDLQGHVHITDFNCACYLEDGKAIISETGTQGYMAPEVYTDVGYRESVDWWSLGVTLYELLHGERPFVANSIEELARLVKTEPVTWNCDTSPEMREFVMGLLTRSTSRRLGCGRHGPLAVRNHALFDKYGYDWDRLVAKELEPPFAPDPTASNFDARFELEELLLEEEAPLVAQRRAHRKSRRPSPAGSGAGDGTASPPNPMARELAVLESEFHMFDYLIFERYTGIVDPFKASVGDPPDWVKCVDPPKPAPAVEDESAPATPEPVVAVPPPLPRRARAASASMRRVASTTSALRDVVVGLLHRGSNASGSLNGSAAGSPIGSNAGSTRSSSLITTPPSSWLAPPRRAVHRAPNGGAVVSGLGGGGGSGAGGGGGGGIAAQSPPQQPQVAPAM